MALDPDLLRQGSTEDIALDLLRGLGGEGATVNGYNLMNDAQQQFSSEPDTAALVGRVGDAWAWLIAHECVGQGLQSSGHWMRVTQQGARLAQRADAALHLQAERLISGDLSPQLRQTAKPAFARGDFETAAFAAMKAVEVEVRTLSGLPDSLVGVKLMQAAFNSDGPLTDQAAEGGEREAIMKLFAGAIGAFKNPASHRTVHFDDPVEVAEIVQFADLLLRMLARTAARRI
ncbi:TIGR02391 family protein [Microbacterium sp. RG1]|uniref:TIGR02391 family protein n=1 Tax=Microbacterium sp. RG1 TaxID=2489212 RepID=UPI0010CA479C|nr:TIGR02391 family protein [Microbacterium sp. RG1]QCQ15846.1 TIGR02391 family protein [Microbacterium sp. RG1]